MKALLIAAHRRHSLCRGGFRRVGSLREVKRQRQDAQQLPHKAALLVVRRNAAESRVSAGAVELELVRKGHLRADCAAGIDLDLRPKYIVTGDPFRFGGRLQLDSWHCFSIAVFEANKRQLIVVDHREGMEVPYGADPDNRASQSRFARHNAGLRGQAVDRPAESPSRQVWPQRSLASCRGRTIRVIAVRRAGGRLVGLHHRHRRGENKYICE